MKISIGDIGCRKEISEIINVFYPNEKVQFDDNEFYIKIDVSEGKISIYSSNKKDIFRYALQDELKISLKRALFTFLKDVTNTEPPWGILVGIRPSKIALRLLEKGYDKEQILKYYKDKYLTSDSKAELCYEVALHERKYINLSKDVISIYIGMPFCPTRCSYCSFASNPIAGSSGMVTPYLQALKHEIESLSKYILEKKLKIQCIYFGGGTPTAINDEEFEHIMSILDKNFYKHHEVVEYTVECGRPDSISKDKLETMSKYGVNRISINPQTMNLSTLKRIGRHHTVEDVIQKFNMARSMGFENINMDVIIGLPGEGLEEVRKTCSDILKLSPENLTVHGMSLKRASQLHEEHNGNKNNNIPQSNSEIYNMYDLSRNLADDLSMKPYYMYRQKNMVGNMENVGYSKIGKECIYNIQMIEEKQTIVALGADAISKIVSHEDGIIERFANVKEVREYVSRIDEMIELKVNLLNKLYC